MKNVAQRELTLRKVPDNNLKFFLTVNSKKHIFMHLTHLRRYHYDTLDYSIVVYLYFLYFRIISN